MLQSSSETIKIKNTLCVNVFDTPCQLLLEEAILIPFSRKFTPPRPYGKLCLNHPILTDLEQPRGGEYCEAVWNGEIEAIVFMDCIVFYSNLKDAGGVLILLDS